MGNIELIEKCYQCQKNTEPHEWFDGLGGWEVVEKPIKRFVCSACGHYMWCGILKEDDAVGPNSPIKIHGDPK